VKTTEKKTKMVCCKQRLLQPWWKNRDYLSTINIADVFCAVTKSQGRSKPG